MYNKIIAIGRLTAQPELTQTPNGKNLTRVTIAVNRRFKTENGEREADFSQCYFLRETGGNTCLLWRGEWSDFY